MIEVHFKDADYAQRAHERLANRLEGAPYTFSIFRKGYVLRFTSVRLRRDVKKDLTAEMWESFRVWVVTQTNQIEKANRRAILKQTFA